MATIEAHDPDALVITIEFEDFTLADDVPVDLPDGLRGWIPAGTVLRLCRERSRHAPRT